MTDRVPGAPGQYKAVITEAELQKMQAGEQFAITLTRDDQPVVEGTPYSKAAVLPEALGKALCPNIDDPTPADAFASLLPKSGGQLTGPLTLSWQNLTGWRALNGMRMGAFRFDTNTTCAVPLGGNKWCALVCVVSPGGYSALYYLAGESGGSLNRTYKICGDDKYGIDFSITTKDVLTVTCNTNWSVGWYITNSMWDDMQVG